MTTIDPWVHLQVASGFSLRYGACMPEELVSAAAGMGQQMIALTDRDGVYGAVRWMQACGAVGIGAILGVELAMHRPSPSTQRKTPARGGTFVDDDRPRVMFFARDARSWASLCRLVTAAHQLRDNPALRWDQICTHSHGLVAVLGPTSSYGRAVCDGAQDLARQLLDRWREVFGERLHVGVTSHHAATDRRYSMLHAAQMTDVARQCGIDVVLTNAVRYRIPEQGQIADVLDAARQMVSLRSGRVQRDNGEAWMKSGAQMAQIAQQIAGAAGYRADGGLLHATRELAEQCVINPSELGIGRVFVPELQVTLGRTDSPDADALLSARCRQELDSRYVGTARARAVDRLADELKVIRDVGFASYFITVGEVVAMIKGNGVRVAARGSGAGSVVNYLLGISGVDPIAQGLLMERFLSPLRSGLPDIDIDVESARREEIYRWILERFGDQRCACVSMMETYRVRHAVRDVGAALGMPPAEVGELAKSFPHIRARHARSALAELPELRTSGFGRLAARGELDGFIALVEALDGLPRHVALHPCGVLLSDASLGDRTPMQPSAAGFPMSQFDKDDVEALGLLKLDVLGVRMQSAIAHALSETKRAGVDVPDIDRIALDDPDTFALIQSTHTLGCFQIESPGQRELIGKYEPTSFSDLIIDISLFRPGPVKSDMIRPFLRARQGWEPAQYPHPDLRPVLEQTFGVVVFHEQVMGILEVMTGCTLAYADEMRRSMGSQAGIDDARSWFYPAALRRGYGLDVVEQVWQVLHSFASFGFCKAHAAAFALPTYQSAWLKTHYPAAFYAGLLTHDPGMYPKRLILDDARQQGVQILGVDINASDAVYRVVAGEDGDLGVRMAFCDVRGISRHEIDALVAGQPYASLTDAWRRSHVSRPTMENLIVTGAFDALYCLGGTARRGSVTRRDLLLQLADLDRHDRGASDGQMSLALLDEQISPSGLPEMSAAEKVRAEISVLGMDVSAHVLDFYAPMLAQMQITRSAQLLQSRSRQQVLVAGVKVAVQTPPVRSGKRVIFVTVDDATGPVDVAFFSDAQERYATTVFSSWLMLIRGTVRRTGPRGVSITATGCWDLAGMYRTWQRSGAPAVWEVINADQPEVAARAQRTLVHATGYRMSPYADVAPPGSPVSTMTASLWHASPGCSG